MSPQYLCKSNTATIAWSASFPFSYSLSIPFSPQAPTVWAGRVLVTALLWVRGWAGWPSGVAPKQHFYGSAVLFFFHRWSELLSTSTCVFRPEEKPKACLIFPTTPVGRGSKFTFAYKPCPEGFVSTHEQSSAWESVYPSFQRKAEAWGSQTTKFIVKSCIYSRGEGLLLNWAKLKYFDSLW